MNPATTAVHALPREAIDAAFWGDRLEVHVLECTDQAQDPEFLAKWIPRLTPRFRSLLAEELGLSGDLGAKDLGARIFGSAQRSGAPSIEGHRFALLPYVLLERFSQRKVGIAVLDVARSVLSPEAITRCRIGTTRYDYRALLFLLHQRDPELLEQVFHLDRIHRKGFAPLILDREIHRQDAGRIRRALRDPQALQQILDAYEREHRTHRQSYCAAVLPRDKGWQVFIKRDRDPNFVSLGRHNAFGYDREWIILDFDDDLRAVRIASLSPDVPLQIAGRIASTCLGQQAGYAPDDRTTPLKKITAFLAMLLNKPDELPLVELTLRGCGLPGSPQVWLSDPESRTIAPALKEWGRHLGDPLEHVAEIDSIKVCFEDKRILLRFEPVRDRPDQFIVRYGDQTLNGKERRGFEQRMWEKYKLRVVSTEKKRAR